MHSSPLDVSDVPNISTAMAAINASIDIINTHNDYTDKKQGLRRVIAAKQEDSQTRRGLVVLTLIFQTQDTDCFKDESQRIPDSDGQLESCSGTIQQPATKITDLSLNTCLSRVLIHLSGGEPDDYKVLNVDCTKQIGQARVEK